MSISSATDSAWRPDPGYRNAWQVRALSVMCAAGALGCADGSRSDTAHADSAIPGNVAAMGDSTRPPPQRVLTGNRVAGILFDPVSVRAGDRIGALTLDSIEVRTALDSTRVGTARFSGRVTVTGTAMRHFDSDVTDLCFEADSASAAKLPRWNGDERRAWFCLENPADARRALGSVSDGSRKSIVIDRFIIHRGMSDEVNSARLVRATDL